MNQMLFYKTIKGGEWHIYASAKQVAIGPDNSFSPFLPQGIIWTND